MSFLKRLIGKKYSSAKTFEFNNNVANDKIEMTNLVVDGDTIKVYLVNGGIHNLSSPQHISVEEIINFKIVEDNGRFNITLKSSTHPRFGNRITILNGLNKEEIHMIQNVIKPYSNKKNELQINLDLILVEGGSFTDFLGHEKVVNSFSISKYPITQKQWFSIMGNSYSENIINDCDGCPVDSVSWYDAKAFIEKLNTMHQSKKFRLPSGTEWEFAAVGGNKSKGYKYAGSNDLNEVAWYIENSNDRIHPVGQKKPNELGIYDMSGNVWEWCQDHWYDESKSLLRGGSYNNSLDSCEVTAPLVRIDSTTIYSNFGFRVARS